MTKYEKKTIETVNKMWKTWENPSAESIEESISTWVQNGKGFGSGLTEIWRGRKGFRAYCERSFQQNPEGFKVATKWVETDHLSEKIVALWGEITITIELPTKQIVIDPIRVTGVFTETEEHEMKLIQWHASEPDISGENELWSGTGDPTYYEDISLMFTDFVGFTEQVSRISPKKLVQELNEIFAAFDTITKTNGLEKIKTIGDAYMAASGLQGGKDHALMAVKTAKQMLQYLQDRNEKNTLKWNMRIGIHSGAVVGGVIGSEKLTFDLWGDTVNMASRIESASEPNKINISRSTFNLVKHIYPCESRGKIDIKGKGKIELFFVQ